MPSRASVTYSALIVCEDIRVEFDGKRTVVGVYTSNAIHVPELPLNAQVSLFTLGEVTSEGAFKGGIEIADGKGNIVYKESAPDEVRLRLGRFNQNLTLPFEVKNDGTLTFTLFDKDNALVSISYEIVVRPPTPQAVAAE